MRDAGDKCLEVIANAGGAPATSEIDVARV